MIDNEEADDKIIAVLQNDYVWSRTENVTDLPPVLIERLVHYFKTYKLVAGEEPGILMGEVYSHQHAQCVVDAAIKDYHEAFGKEGMA